MKQFEYKIFIVKPELPALITNGFLPCLGLDGWQLVNKNDKVDENATLFYELLMMREVKPKDDVPKTPCEQVLNEVREILKTKENFSVIQRAKEVMALITNHEENNGRLINDIADLIARKLVPIPMDNSEFRNLKL